MTHRGPFQPLPFCDSVILEVCVQHTGCAEASCSCLLEPCFQTLFAACLWYDGRL